MPAPELTLKSLVLLVSSLLTRSMNFIGESKSMFAITSMLYMNFSIEKAVWSVTTSISQGTLGRGLADPGSSRESFTFGNFTFL